MCVCVCVCVCVYVFCIAMSTAMARASVPSAGLDLNIGVVMNKRVSADVFYSQLEYVQITLRFSRLVHRFISWCSAKLSSRCSPRKPTSTPTTSSSFYWTVMTPSKAYWYACVISRFVRATYFMMSYLPTY